MSQGHPAALRTGDKGFSSSAEAVAGETGGKAPCADAGMPFTIPRASPQHVSPRQPHPYWEHRKVSVVRGLQQPTYPRCWQPQQKNPPPQPTYYLTPEPPSPKETPRAPKSLASTLISPSCSPHGGTGRTQTPSPAWGLSPWSQQRCTAPSSAGLAQSCRQLITLF